MQKKFKCKCGAQFAPTDLSGKPRTQCPICRADLPITAHVVAPSTTPAPPTPVKSPTPPPNRPQAQVPTPAPITNPTAKRQPWPIQKIAMLVTAVFLLLMSIAWGLIGLRDSDQGAASKTWPSVTGTIVASSMNRRQNVGRYAYTRYIESYDVDLQYSYRVNGQTWYGDKIGLGDLPVKRDEAEALLNRYSLGSTHKVYYDPADPAVAVLTPGYDGMARFHIIFGVVLPLGCFAVGALLLIAAFCIPNDRFPSRTSIR